MIPIIKLIGTGKIFILIFIFVSNGQLAAGLEGCWWTGCQPDSWSVKGCEQYGRIEVAKKTCTDGNEYHCCIKAEHTTPMNNISETTQVDIENSDKKSVSKIKQNSCWWSECQTISRRAQGCPKSMVENNQKSCSDGKVYECCPRFNFTSTVSLSNIVYNHMKEKETGNENNSEDIGQTQVRFSGQTFVNFVKTLLMKARNFTLEPDNLRCDSIDPEKKYVIKIKNEGIRFCDLYPSLPQLKFTNIVLDINPLNSTHNNDFLSCFGFSDHHKECVAFSYDHETDSCYIFNNTIGKFKTEAEWTTILMTQPTGILQNWIYSRHTSISGKEMLSVKQEDFLDCLTFCEERNNCKFISYSLIDKNCGLFCSDDSIEMVDLNYDHISAYSLSSIKVGDELVWRFNEENLKYYQIKKKMINPKDGCSNGDDPTYKVYYSKKLFN